MGEKRKRAKYKAFVMGYKERTKDILADARKGKEGTISRSILTAGKELVLMCLWFESVGAQLQDNIPSFIASILGKHSAELKEALAFYDDMKGQAVKALLMGFEVNITGDFVEGVKLWLHPKWKKLPPYIDTEKHKNSYAEDNCANNEGGRTK